MGNTYFVIHGANQNLSFTEIDEDNLFQDGAICHQHGTTWQPMSARSRTCPFGAFRLPAGSTMFWGLEKFFKFWYCYLYLPNLVFYWMLKKSAFIRVFRIINDWFPRNWQDLNKNQVLHITFAVLVHPCHFLEFSIFDQILHFLELQVWRILVPHDFVHSFLPDGACTWRKLKL